jgi:hypothetical protein
MKKLYEIGSKTGLKTRELHKVARFGLLGLTAALLAVLSACFKSSKQPPAAPEPSPQSDVRPDPSVLRDPAVTLDKSSGTDESKGDNCGPYPGYPCGTRYYTVSVSDFNRDPGVGALTGVKVKGKRAAPWMDR